MRVRFAEPLRLEILQGVLGEDPVDPRQVGDHPHRQRQEGADEEDRSDEERLKVAASAIDHAQQQVTRERDAAADRHEGAESDEDHVRPVHQVCAHDRES
jgi:hypothetical protein